MNRKRKGRKEGGKEGGRETERESKKVEIYTNREWRRVLVEMLQLKCVTGKNLFHKSSGTKYH